MERSEREAILYSINVPGSGYGADHYKELMQMSAEHQKVMLDILNRGGWQPYMVKSSPKRGAFFLNTEDNVTPYIKGFFVKCGQNHPASISLLANEMVISKLEFPHWIGKGSNYYEIPFFYSDFIFPVAECHFNEISVKFESKNLDDEPTLIVWTASPPHGEEIPKRAHYCVLPFPNPYLYFCIAGGSCGLSEEDRNIKKPFNTILHELIFNMHATLNSGKNDCGKFMLHVDNLKDWEKAAGMVHPREVRFNKVNSLQYMMNIWY